MQVSGFPTSCATPAASRPAAANRSERTICSCSLRSDVTSFTTARTALTSPAAPLKNDAEMFTTSRAPVPIVSSVS